MKILKAQICIFMAWLFAIILFINANLNAQTFSDSKIYYSHLQNTTALKNVNHLALDLGIGISKDVFKNVNVSFSPIQNIGIKFDYANSGKNEFFNDRLNVNHFNIAAGAYKFLPFKNEGQYKTGLVLDAYFNYNFGSINKPFQIYNTTTYDYNIRYSKIKFNKFGINLGAHWSTLHLINIDIQSKFSVLNFSKIAINFEPSDAFFETVEYLKENDPMMLMENCLRAQLGGVYLRFYVAVTNSVNLVKKPSEGLNYKSIATNSGVYAGLAIELNDFIDLIKSGKPIKIKI